MVVVQMGNRKRRNDDDNSNGSCRKDGQQLA